MEYCYSGTESLWYGSWNRHGCRKGKCAADRHSRSTGVNPSRKQRCCSPSFLWSQAQRDTFDLDISQNLGYWLTISHRCICVWSWTTMLYLVHLSRRLKCTIVIMRCPSSVNPSVVRRLSSLTFHIFDFSSETTERNLTKLDRMQDLNVLYQVCVFRADRKNKMAAPASDWLRHFRLLLWNRWTEFNETWQEARSQCPLPSLCFWADRKYKMAALTTDWLRHFRLLLWNRWTEFIETWQEARSQRPLPSFCFLGRLEKQMVAPASD